MRILTYPEPGNYKEGVRLTTLPVNKLEDIARDVFSEKLSKTITLSKMAGVITNVWLLDGKVRYVETYNPVADSVVGRFDCGAFE